MMQKGFTLAVSTATPICSVAIAEGNRILASRTVREHGKHAELLPELVQNVMDVAGVDTEQITSVLFESGPGSYTGLRIGLSFLKGFFFQHPIQAFGINTLTAIGAWVLDHHEVETVHAVLDARRNHVYYQAISRTKEGFELSEPTILTLEDVKIRLQSGQVLAGTGVHRFYDLPQHLMTVDVLLGWEAPALVMAAALFGGSAMVQEVELSVAEPFYLGAPV